MCQGSGSSSSAPQIVDEEALALTAYREEQGEGKEEEGWYEEP